MPQRKKSERKLRIAARGKRPRRVSENMETKTGPSQHLKTTRSGKRRKPRDVAAKRLVDGGMTEKTLESLIDLGIGWTRTTTFDGYLEKRRS